MNVTAIVAAVPLVVMYVATRRPVGKYSRPKYALELGTIVLCGSIGSSISSDVGTLVAIMGIVPLIALNASNRKCVRLSNTADVEALRRALQVTTTLMWPTVATPLTVRIHRQVADMTNSPDEHLAWLNEVAEHPRATPLAKLERSMILGTGNEQEIARSLLAEGTQADDQVAGARVLAFFDLPAVLDWCASQRSRRSQQIQTHLDFTCLIAAGRLDTVDRILTKTQANEFDRAIIRSQVESAAGILPDVAIAPLHRFGTIALGEIRRRAMSPIVSQELSPQQSSIVDAMERRSLGTTAATGKDMGSWRPLVTWSICIVIALAFAAQLASGPLDSQHLYDMGGFATGGAAVEWWRALTAPYLHASTAHMAFNVLSLLALGRLVEAQLPRHIFLFLWLAASSGSFLLLGVVERDEVALTIGASGGVMGVLGAGIVLYAVAMKRNPNPLTRRLLVLTVGLAAMQLLLDNVVPQVSKFGHIAGLGCGLIIAALWVATNQKPADAA